LIHRGELRDLAAVAAERLAEFVHFERVVGYGSEPADQGDERRRLFRLQAAEVGQALPELNGVAGVAADELRDARLNRRVQRGDEAADDLGQLAGIDL